MRLLTCAAGDGKTATYAYREDVGQNKRDNMIASINIPGVTRFDYSYDANKNKLSEIINNGSGIPARRDPNGASATQVKQAASRLTTTWACQPLAIS